MGASTRCYPHHHVSGATLHPASHVVCTGPPALRMECADVWWRPWAMVGLVLFVDGLRVAIMPLGSVLGQQLPEHFKVRYILVVACAIGILCTYAEPAIASLRPLASLVKRCQTPYLYFVLNDMSEVLVLSIGLGVGVAAMIGVLRFLRGWSLKPLIAIRYVLTLGTYIVKFKRWRWKQATADVSRRG